MLARLRQQDAEVVVAARQVAAELGDGGVVVGQLLLDRQRLAVLGLRFRRLARLPPAESAILLIVAARSRRDSAVAPGAAASASWSARARR